MMATLEHCNFTIQTVTMEATAVRDVGSGGCIALPKSLIFFLAIVADPMEPSKSP